MDILDSPMTVRHYSPGRPHGPPRLLVLHATAGSWPGDLAWLRQGGSAAAPVSCHYLISPAGEIHRLVDERDTAWHTGAAAWEIDGQRVSGSVGGVAALNWRSIGIELSHPNRATVPYPQAQINAAIWLARDIVRRWSIPPSQLVRHLDIAPGRKVDPAGLDWPAFVGAVYDSSPPAPPYDANSPIIGPARGTQAQAVEWFAARTRLYTRYDITQIVAAYARLGEAVGVDWFLALAQCAHETGNLTAHLSGRPYRNPAGLGVTGESSPEPRDGFVWDADRKAYRKALTFAAWTPEEAGGTVSSIEAHLGRLLAYALPPGHRFGPTQAMADKALSLRGLPLTCHGSAPTLKMLGRVHNPADPCGWASPGDRYGEAVAALANRMRLSKRIRGLNG